VFPLFHFRIFCRLYYLLLLALPATWREGWSVVVQRDCSLFWIPPRQTVAGPKEGGGWFLCDPHSSNTQITSPPAPAPSSYLLLLANNMMITKVHRQVPTVFQWHNSFVNQTFQITSCCCSSTLEVEVSVGSPLDYYSVIFRISSLLLLLLLFKCKRKWVKNLLLFIVEVAVTRPLVMLLKIRL